MKSTPRFTGTYVALVTPFDARGEYDDNAYRRLIEHVIAGGAEGVVSCATTGEKSTLTTDEHKHAVERAIAIVDGRLKVVADTGSNDTAHATMMATFAKAAGADAGLSVVPYYNKPTQEGLFRHYSHIAEHADFPIVIYNVPSRTVANIAVETVERLLSDARVIGIKDATGDMDVTMRLVRAATTHRRPDFSILSGDDSRTLPMIAVGAHGCISVVANETPKLFSDMVRAALGGDYATARELQYRLLDLMSANFLETNPIPVKYALATMGLIQEQYRLPLCPMSDANKAKMDKVLQELALVP